MIAPDGFIGAVMAVEGFRDSLTVLHSPDGCRMNIAVLANKCYPRIDPNNKTSFFSSGNRVPCTSISPDDYIFGGYEKLVDTLKKNSSGHEVIAIISSPGASLIGDDCERAARECGVLDRTIIMDAKMISRPINEGIDVTLTSIADRFLSKTDCRRKGTVNLLGISILFRDWETVVEEFRQLLELMGLEVIAAVGAGCSMEDFIESSSMQSSRLNTPRACHLSTKNVSEPGQYPLITRRSVSRPPKNG